MDPSRTLKENGSGVKPPEPFGIYKKLVAGDLKNSQTKAALEVLASHRRNEFLPQWSPPPWPEYGEGDKNPSLTEIVKALETRNDVPESLPPVRLGEESLRILPWHVREPQATRTLERRRQSKDLLPARF